MISELFARNTGLKGKLCHPFKGCDLLYIGRLIHSSFIPETVLVLLYNWGYVFQIMLRFQDMDGFCGESRDLVQTLGFDKTKFGSEEHTFQKLDLKLVTNHSL